MTQENENNPGESFEVDGIAAADNKGDFAAAEVIQPAPPVPPVAPSYTQEPATPYQGAPAYPAAPHYPMPPEASIGEPVPQNSKLGMVAFYASLAGLVFGAVILYFAGHSLGEICTIIECTDSSALDETLIMNNSAAAAILGKSSMLMLLGFFIWGALSLWGLIQGIIAMVKKRGRGWGLAALLIAVLGAIPVFGIFTIGAAASMAPYVM